MSGTHEPRGVRLRPASGDDSFLVRRWLRDPATHASWGSRASAEAEFTLAQMQDAALCRIVTCENTPVGYAQAVETGLLSGSQPPELVPGTWDIAFCIASPGHRSAAILSAVPALMAGEVFATTLAVQCAALVSIRHEAVARAYERAGFRWKRVWHDPLLGPAWLMLMERPRR